MAFRIKQFYSFYSELTYFTVVNSTFNSIKSIFREKVTKNGQHPTVTRRFCIKNNLKNKNSRKVTDDKFIFLFIFIKV